MSRSTKPPPVGPEPLDLINHIRQLKLDQIHSAFDGVRLFYPDQYVIIADFFLRIKPHGTKQ